MVPDSNVVVKLTSSSENPRADCEPECWLGPPDTAPKNVPLYPVNNMYYRVSQKGGIYMKNLCIHLNYNDVVR